MSAGSIAPRKKRNKGPRPKHVPQRMCITCRAKSAKRGLTRVVRTPEGKVLIDPTGKANGRGAYLCDNRSCWDRSIATNGLSRALNIDVGSEVREMLREHAATLLERDDPPAESEEGHTQ
jgi:predicted RNA-binding protein YlxR (DUF448 family)